MNIGFVGLGKLGLPCAVTMQMQGHNVLGYDRDQSRMSKAPQEYMETGPDGGGDFNQCLERSKIKFGSLQQVVAHGDLVFVAVQTPHDPIYEGIARLPQHRQDFEYEYLRGAIRQIAEASNVQHPFTLAVISTVLPGTCRRELMPLLAKRKHISLAYNPSFIAMGMVMRDFLHPEFVLVGCENAYSRMLLEEFYQTITAAPIRYMSLESAELTKVAYNTFISLKIAFANTVMEICEKLDVADADCDTVMQTLGQAHTRLISPQYLVPGMGDGGGCHPRDNIAMSWLARKLDLSYDIFEAAMLCRERQAEYIAMLAINELQIRPAERFHRPICILGKAFKPETNITVGSPAVLVGNIIAQYDLAVEYADDQVRTALTEAEAMTTPTVFIIGCRHARYAKFKFPTGSVIIDPHRYIPHRTGLTVHDLGAGRRVW